jgi:hypothetical protein
MVPEIRENKASKFTLTRAPYTRTQRLGPRGTMLRQATGLDCALQAIHHALEKMGLTYKKDTLGQASKDPWTSPRSAETGGAIKPRLTRPGQARIERIETASFSDPQWTHFPHRFYRLQMQ